MKVLHLLVSGNLGGIEVLMKNYAQHTQLDHVFVFVWEGGPIADEMKQRGYDTIVLNKQKDSAIKTLQAIISICKEKKVTAVVSHHSAPLLKVALLCLECVMPSIKRIAYVHANTYDVCEAKRKKGLWLRKTVHKLAFLSADGVVAISESVKKSVQEYLGVKRPIQVIYNGVPVEDFCHQRKRNDKVLTLMYVGRLTKEKGVQTVIRGLAEIVDTIPFVFYIVGDGSYRNDLTALAHECGVSEQVRFLGRQNDVPKLLSQADVFVHMPMWEEGFGITIVEAMASGCICVCSKNGAIPEIITHGENGFLVEKDSWQALAKMLQDLYQNWEELLQQMTQQARERAKEFSIQRYAKAFDAFLEEI